MRKDENLYILKNAVDKQPLTAIGHRLQRRKNQRAGVMNLPLFKTITWKNQNTNAVEGD